VRHLYGNHAESIFGGLDRTVDESAIMVLETTSQELDLDGLPMKFLALPCQGLCAMEVSSGSAFVGNSFGVAYPSLTGRIGTRLVVPLPWDALLRPDATVQAVDIVMSATPQRAYLGHYGMVSDVAAAATQAMHSAVYTATCDIFGRKIRMTR